MKLLITSLLFAFCAFCSANIVSSTEMRAPQAVVYGIVDGSRAYFTAMKDSKQKVGGANMVTAGLADGNVNSRYFLPISVSPDYQYRWKLNQTGYWAIVLDKLQDTQYIVHLLRASQTDLRKYDLDEMIRNRPGKPVVDKEKAINAAVRKSAADYRSIKLCKVDPLTHALIFADYDRRTPVHYDILPVSENTVRLFIYPASPYIEVWEYSERSDDEAGRYRGEWEKLEKFSVGFTKPFRVFSKGSTYFFVTDSGSVYAAKKSGDTRNVELLWDEENGPVRAVIENINNSKAFAFTDDTCFELDDLLKPKKYEKTKELKEAKEPLKKVVEYGKLCK